MISILCMFLKTMLPPIGKGLLTWVTFSAMASLLICNFVISVFPTLVLGVGNLPCFHWFVIFAAFLLYPIFI